MTIENAEAQFMRPESIEGAIKSPRLARDSQMLDLGIANGWPETPEIVRKCRDARKRGERHNYTDFDPRGICLHYVQCHTCGYRFKYDSSG